MDSQSLLSKLTLNLKQPLIILSLLFFFNASTQIPSNKSLFAKNWSQDLTLSLAKVYLLQDIISVSNVEERLVVDAIVASNSGHLTSVCYSGDSARTVGLLLGFYGDYWNDEGIIYKGYAFKNLTSEKTFVFLQKLLEIPIKYKDYMNKTYDNNNIILTYDDIKIIV
jgi:hypothetical protein